MTNRPPQLFDIPEGTPPTDCRGCKATVYWIVTAAGKRMPVVRVGDTWKGTSHFADCPDAARFRKPR